MLKTINQRLTSLVRNFPRNDWKFQKNLQPFRCADDGLVAVVLARPKDIHDAIWSAYSVVTFVSQVKRLHFMFDGLLGPKLLERIKTIFPNAKISNVQTIAAAYASRNKWCSSVSQRLLAPKLFSILELSNQEPILYLDSDVLFFQEAKQLSIGIEEGQGRILHDSGTWNQDNELLDRSDLLGLRAFRDANSGAMYIPKSSFPRNELADLYNDPMQTNSRFFEQTTLGILAANSNFVQLPGEHYFISAQGMNLWDVDIDYSEVVCRHFTGLVRHRLRMQGVPHLISRLKDRSMFRGQSSVE